MHVAPDLVRPLAVAGDGHERRWKIRALREGWVWSPRRWTQVSADTGTGNPALATAEKGRQYAEQVTAAFGEFLVELAGADVEELYE
jgi:creatinine amidohydrolase